MRFLISILGVLLACTRQPNNLQSLTLISPTSQRIDLRVEIADDPAERSRGLMFREELSMGRGMLFIFDKPQILSFWMKNTVMPLDILFFDEGGSFVSTVTMTPCTADPCQTYPSDAEAQYALEVPAGFVGQYNIGEGWWVLLVPSPRLSATSSRSSDGRGQGEGPP
ncbi:DUF192 domain-containing protein [Candidatus Peregrinibacteria bacterium]|nr:DUF192 domain-containing protein [Candidatus Peregrinibacteria bacterium]